MTIAKLLQVTLSLCAVLANAYVASDSSALTVRQSSTFPKFLRRSFHGSFVLSNGNTRTLYVDGGEQRYDNASVQVVNNYTLAIDLSSSFSTSVTNNHIIPVPIDKKGAPVLSSSHFWKNNGSVIAYGGEWSYINIFDERSDIPLDGLWTFSGSGATGTWTNKADTTNSVWNSLIRPEGGASTYAEGVGAWHLGGRATRHTDQKTFFSDDVSHVALPGIQFYNYTDRSWGNFSSSGFGRDGTYYLGQMQHVPNWGSYGLIVAFGGGPVESTSSNLFDMSNITVWDPATHTWYSQTATAATGNDMPPQRLGFCVVGASSGVNGTYEIFVYGGAYSSNSITTSTDYVWILSLPAFQWFRADASTNERRFFHRCHGVNRQLLSVGGLDPSVNNAPANLIWDVKYNDTDDYTEGLKVFDMTALKWTNYYDATAAAYDTPDIVKNFYSKNKDSSGNVYPSTWNSGDLKAIFTGQKGAITSTSPNSPAATSSSPKGSGTSAPSHVSGGAIAGGVIGGLAVLGAIIGGVIFCMRRKRKSNGASNAAAMSGQPGYPVDTKKDHTYYFPKQELPAGKVDYAQQQQYQYPKVELPAQPTQGRAEMWDPTQYQYPNNSRDGRAELA